MSQPSILLGLLKSVLVVLIASSTVTNLVTRSNADVPTIKNQLNLNENHKHPLNSDTHNENQNLTTTTSGGQVHKNRLSLKDGHIVFRTDPNFLSFTIDSKHLERGLNTMKLTDPRLISLTKHLSPAYLRIGGISADRLLFSRNTTASLDLNIAYFTGADYLAIHKFARQTNTELIFDLNVLRRTTNPSEEHDSSKRDIETLKISKENHDLKRDSKTQDNNIDESEASQIGKETGNLIVERIDSANKGPEIATFRDLEIANLMIENEPRVSESSWNSSNAADLLKFCEEQGLHNHWQLGNEPNAYMHNFNVTISPEQLAADFRALKSLLSQSSFHGGALIIGPDVTRPLKDKTAEGSSYQMSPVEYLDKFLSHEGNGAIDAVGFHQYYLNGSSSMADYLSPATFDLLDYQISVVKKIVEKNYENHVEKPPLWLSETGSCVAGGKKGLTDTFASSFLWIDKLGLAAKMGVSVVLRQSLEFGNYSLVDWETLAPNPDWWLSVLYKRLVDPRVLDIFLPLSHKTLRLYSHCSPSNNITVFGINSGQYEEPLYFDAECHVNYYAVTQRGDDLRTRDIVLNFDTLLQLNSDGSLPRLVPIRYHVRHARYITIPAFSVVFLEIQLDEYHECKG